MIYGIGTDMVAVGRIAAALERRGEAFARRILSPEEWEGYSGRNDGVHYVARRFAAKEAFAKALGTGIRGLMGWQALHVLHDELGKPAFGFSAPFRAHLEQIGIRAHHLSISDEQEMACAFVILER